jgi:hypothetical protein
VRASGASSVEAEADRRVWLILGGLAPEEPFGAAGKATGFIVLSGGRADLAVFRVVAAAGLCLVVVCRPCALVGVDLTTVAPAGEDGLDTDDTPARGVADRGAGVGAALGEGRLVMIVWLAIEGAIELALLAVDGARWPIAGALLIVETDRSDTEEGLLASDGALLVPVAALLRAAVVVDTLAVRCRGSGASSLPASLDPAAREDGTGGLTTGAAAFWPIGGLRKEVVVDTEAVLGLLGPASTLGLSLFRSAATERVVDLAFTVVADLAVVFERRLVTEGVGPGEDVLRGVVSAGLGRDGLVSRGRGGPDIDRGVVVVGA